MKKHIFLLLIIVQVLYSTNDFERLEKELESQEIKIAQLLVFFAPMEAPAHISYKSKLITYLKRLTQEEQDDLLGIFSSWNRSSRNSTFKQLVPIEEQIEWVRRLPKLKQKEGFVIPEKYKDLWQDHRKIWDAAFIGITEQQDVVVMDIATHTNFFGGDVNPFFRMSWIPQEEKIEKVNENS